MPLIEARKRAWSLSLLVWVACGQAQPRDSAQAVHSKSAPARERPVVAPMVADAAAPEAPVSAAPGSCDGGETLSALAMAAFAGDAERARVLVVAAEQDASAATGCTATPLMMAISRYDEEPGTPASDARVRTRGKLDAAGLLLARCFDIGGIDAQGMSALHAAVAAPYPDHVVTRLVERMLECGVSADLKTHEGVTPLMLAVAAKRKGLVRTFLEGGADVHAQSDAGDSALSIAEKNHDRELLAVLRKPASRDGGR
jgi:hypothetical protein